jgi:hypothetical protein
MRPPIRLHRPSPAVVIASLALAAALTPPAYSAIAPHLAKNSVGSSQIRDKAIKAADIAKGAVNSSKIADGQVHHGDLANGAVDFTKIADGTVGRAELSGNSVDGSKIADGSVGVGDLASPVRARAWVAYPSSDVPVAPGATVGLGSLAANGGGPLAVNRATVLTIAGQLYFNAPITAGDNAKGRIACTLAVDGVALAPRSWSRVEQGDEATVPVWGVAVVQAGNHDVSLSCRNDTSGTVPANLGRVGVSVVAVPQ